MPDYQRVLPPISESDLPSRSHLERLGQAMMMPEGELLAHGCDTHGPLAGYTYWGQFIDHDITENHTEVPDGDATIDPAGMTNEARPWLDLHHVYGPTADLSKPWYDQSSPDRAKLFRLDPTVRGTVAPGLEGARLDLPRAGDGKPLMPDPRNCENLVIAQLHVLFLRWHNLAVNQIDQIRCPGLPPGTPFKRARTLVTWQYQRLILRDYLYQTIDRNLLSEIHDDAAAHRPPKFFGGPSLETIFVPVEFSAAAFRFGHSMVRQSYRYNDWQNATHTRGVVPLLDLIDNARNFTALPHDWLIDWTRFFPGPRHPILREPAQQINTQFAPAMHGVPIVTVQKFSDVHSEKNKAGGGGMPGAIDLPVRTLLRGRALRLTTGQDAARSFGEKEILGNDKLDVDLDGKLLPAFQELRDSGLSDRTPLFYYVLWEAERNQCGNRLGRVGGRIVAEVIEGLIKQDPNGYVKNAGENWQSPEWIFPDGTSRAIENFADIIHLLDAWLPPGHPRPDNRQLRLIDRIFYRINWLKSTLRELVGFVGVRKRCAERLAE